MGDGDTESVWNDVHEQEVLLKKEAEDLSEDLLFRRDGCLKRLLTKPFADIDLRRIAAIIVS
ncbi:MAG: hypothetical protein APR53_05690 [Methanoculleus sp. SDB]|nr:MAG: hypothetical protein APR53_05690 [Methanoculleus sp. SDB]